MVCIAAFIILCLISVVVAFLSIFKRDIGKKWWTVFKKAWHCVFKKVRLQKCDTNFKDDVKNTILKKVIIKHPKWVKPISVTIEIVSVLIVIITIWSIVIAVKSLLAIWVFGTCNVSQPASCSLGAEVCSIDEEEPDGFFGGIGRWFTEWGEIFAAIPDRLHAWPAENYAVGIFATSNSASVSNADGQNSGNRALDIVDPGCSICMQSYKNQLSSDFINTHNLIVMPYVIKLPDGTEKFKNSELATRYLIALALYDNAENSETNHYKMFLDRLFTEYNKDHINYQSYVQSLSAEQADKLFQSWLKDFGIKSSDITVIKDRLNSEVVNNYLAEIANMVENTIKAKGIPTLIYDNQLHSGLFKS